jgi:hypothetical protein
MRVAIEDRSKHCLRHSVMFGHSDNKLGTRPTILGQRTHELRGAPGVHRHPFSVLRQAHDLGEPDCRVEVGIQYLANISRIVAMGSVEGLICLRNSHLSIVVSFPNEVFDFRTPSTSFDEIAVEDVTSIREL